MKTAPPPLVVERTEGVRLSRSRTAACSIDGIASWWTACHGYNHPHIRAAVAAQLERMPHVMLGGLAHAPADDAGARLAALLPGDLEHVFFTESGSVAVEVAMKIALQYSLQSRRARARTRFLCFRSGYHGDTFAAMSVCDPEEGMHRLFGAVLPQAARRAAAAATRSSAREFERTRRGARATSSRPSSSSRSCRRGWHEVPLARDAGARSPRRRAATACC